MLWPAFFRRMAISCLWYAAARGRGSALSEFEKASTERSLVYRSQVFAVLVSYHGSLVADAWTLLCIVVWALLNTWLPGVGCEVTHPARESTVKSRTLPIKALQFTDCSAYLCCYYAVRGVLRNERPSCMPAPLPSMLQQQHWVSCIQAQ